MSNDGDRRARILAHVLEIIEARSGKQNVTEHCSLWNDVGLDSIALIDIADELRRAFEVDLLAAPNSVDDLRSPGAIADALVRSKSDSLPAAE